MSNYQSIVNLECPDCGEPCDIEIVEQLCMDIYNGVCGECSSCKSEFSITVYCDVVSLGKNEEEE